MQAAEYELMRDILVIRLKADLDHHTAITVRESADSLLAKHHAKHILFDFTGVEFMDSSGIGVIMGRYRQVIFKGGRIGVTGVKAGVERIFKLSGLYKIIERYESETEAFLRPVTEYYAGR